MNKKLEKELDVILSFKKITDYDKEDIKKLFNEQYKDLSHRFIVNSILKVYFDTLFTEMNFSPAIFAEDKYNEMFSFILKTGSMTQASETFGLTRERCKQIFQTGLRLLGNRCRRMKREYDSSFTELNKAMKLLESENKALKEYIELTSKFIKEDISHKNDMNYSDAKILLTVNLFEIPLHNLDLSVRAYNCLKAADIKNLGELVSFDLVDLIKFRNFGKKSLRELEYIVREKNLVFGMDVNKYKVLAAEIILKSKSN